MYRIYMSLQVSCGETTHHAGFRDSIIVISTQFDYTPAQHANKWREDTKVTGGNTQLSGDINMG